MHSHNISVMNPQRVATAALQGFFSITERWGLSAKQQRILLGDPAKSTFSKWKSEKKANKLDSGTLERISYILGIHKALRMLLPTEQAAYEWVNKPNDAPLFCGEPALSRMLAGRVADLYEVRRYLDSEGSLNARLKLSGSVAEYIDPVEPVGEADWEVNKQD